MPRVALGHALVVEARKSTVETAWCALYSVRVQGPLHLRAFLAVALEEGESLARPVPLRSFSMTARARAATTSGPSALVEEALDSAAWNACRSRLAPLLEASRVSAVRARDSGPLAPDPPARAQVELQRKTLFAQRRTRAWWALRLRCGALELPLVLESYEGQRPRPWSCGRCGEDAEPLALAPDASAPWCARCLGAVEAPSVSAQATCPRCGLALSGEVPHRCPFE